MSGYHWSYFVIKHHHLFKTAEIEKPLHLAEVGLSHVAALLQHSPGIRDRLLPLIDMKMVFTAGSHQGGITLICIEFVENFLAKC